LSLIGWLGHRDGTFVAVGESALRLPGEAGVGRLPCVGRLVCVLAYTLSQWREIAKVFSRRQTRYGTLMAVSILTVLGDSGRHQTTSAPSRTSAGI